MDFLTHPDNGLMQVTQPVIDLLQGTFKAADPVFEGHRIAPVPAVEFGTPEGLRSLDLHLERVAS